MRFINRALVVTVAIALSATAARAVDFGAHVGYFGNDVKKVYVGADLALPFGMFALVPNIDYTRSNGIGLWYGNIDGALRFTPSGSGTMLSVGAGPTYGYVTGYGSSSTRGYAIVRENAYGGGGGGGGGTTSPVLGPGFNGNSSAWGWDINAAASFHTGMLRPYATLRYDKVKNVKATGLAVGLRFGR